MAVDGWVVAFVWLSVVGPSPIVAADITERVVGQAQFRQTRSSALVALMSGRDRQRRCRERDVMPTCMSAARCPVRYDSVKG